MLENHSYQFGVSSKLLNQLFVLLSVEGLHAVVVTDRDGVPVIKGKTGTPVTVVVMEML